MRYKVMMTESAVRDLEELDDYISTHDSIESANYVLDSLSEVINTLNEFPSRGNYPPELSALGIQEYREVFFKPYRVIYRVLEKNVYIYLICDGRRDMQSFLQRRLFSV